MNILGFNDKFVDEIDIAKTELDNKKTIKDKCEIDLLDFDFKKTTMQIRLLLSLNENWFTIYLISTSLKSFESQITRFIPATCASPALVPSFICLRNSRAPSCKCFLKITRIPSRNVSSEGWIFEMSQVP